MPRRPVRKTIESRLTTVERGIKSLQASDAAIIRSMRDGFSQMESRFAHMESRFDQIYNHFLLLNFCRKGSRPLFSPVSLHSHDL